MVLATSMQLNGKQAKRGDNANVDIASFVCQALMQDEYFLVRGDD